MESQAKTNRHELHEVVRALRFRSHINSLIRDIDNEKDLARMACEAAAEAVAYRMAWIGLADHDLNKTVRPLAWAGQCTDYLTNIKISWGQNEYGHGPTGAAIREMRPIFCSDFATDPRIAPWREEGLKHGFRSSISLPLLVNDTAIGAFTLYADEPGRFPDEEIQLLAEVAKDLAHAITSLRIKAQRAQALKDLEIAREEAVSANRLKSQFIDIAAHELRTPLTVFSLLIQSTKAQLKLGKKN